MQPNALAGKRVLIAEDEPVIAMDHAAQLVQAGAKIVATCATVRSAVDCLREKAIDVAVIDFVLADGNSERLQTALKGKHIPFVVVSAYPRALVRTEPGPGDPAEAAHGRCAVRPCRGRLQASGLRRDIREGVGLKQVIAGASCSTMSGSYLSGQRRAHPTKCARR
jgi:CheY-like chemotaxis protein